MTLTYFDNAATTAVDPRVLEVMLPFFSERYGNASEIHGLGRIAREALAVARHQVAAAMGAADKEIVFTSGGTESDNLALTGYLQRFPGGHLVVGAIEHPAVIETARHLMRQGWEVTFAPVDSEGTVDVEAFAESFRSDTRLASVMLANNVVGTVQPVRELAQIARDHGAVFHTDAVQAVGALRVNVDELGVDLLSLSGHKFYGPKGVGALYVRRGTRIGALLHGGGHERRLRSGTENVPAIVGLGAAIEIATAAIDSERPRLESLRDRLAGGLLDAIGETVLLGHPTRRLPGNVCVSVKYVEGESMVLQLDGAGFAVASGSACASGSLEPSHVVLAMGYRAEDAHGSVRLTLGRSTTDDDVSRFLEVFPPIVERLRAMSPLYVKR